MQKTQQSKIIKLNNANNNNNNSNTNVNEKNENKIIKLSLHNTQSGTTKDFLIQKMERVKKFGMNVNNSMTMNERIQMRKQRFSNNDKKRNITDLQSNNHGIYHPSNKKFKKEVLVFVFVFCNLFLFLFFFCLRKTLGLCFRKIAPKKIQFFKRNLIQCNKKSLKEPINLIQSHNCQNI